MCELAEEKFVIQIVSYSKKSTVAFSTVRSAGFIVLEIKTWPKGVNYSENVWRNTKCDHWILS